MQPNIYSEAGKNVLRTWIFMIFFLLLTIALGYFIAYWYQNASILYVAVIFAVVMNITSYWYSDKIVLSLHHARQATREEFFDLWNVTENLAITAGLPMPRLFVIDDPAPNAFATGRNKEHAVVCVTTGLLQILNKTELEGVIAHELSHIGNRDILLSTVVVVLAGFVSILSHMFLRGLSFGGRRRDENGGNIFAIVGIVLAILSPIFATLIQLAISRRREFLADASGALLTRYPEGLASALRKIGASAQAMQTANNADAHLFIANPFGAGKIQKLFMTHPPIPERVHALTGE
ncbi:zinc metalloprotease HtpX [Candidatus Parcubacteria bacterium]|nr:zinc metalloprotease HtpX [Candidatus Parcubacteria bacterium]